MIKLVIADDEKLIREVVRQFIDWQSLNIEVVEVCKDGLEALNAIQKHKPELVLTDIKMPGMTGLELASYFSKRPEYIIEFLFLTGYEEFDFAMAAIENNVHHYLVKPLKEARVIEAVQQAVRTVQRRKYADQLLKENVFAPQQRVYSDHIQQILDIVQLNYHNPDLSLKQIADTLLFMNVDYLGRQFHAECGKRFTQYLTELRISKAEYLLRYTNDSVNKIAEKIGYGNNPKYFSSVFRKATGLSPLSYRHKKSAPSKNHLASS